MADPHHNRQIPWQKYNAQLTQLFHEHGTKWTVIGHEMGLCPDRVRTHCMVLMPGEVRTAMREANDARILATKARRAQRIAEGKRTHHVHPDDDNYDIVRGRHIVPGCTLPTLPSLLLAIPVIEGH